jgi:CBS-domain-containing membrane protein
MLELTAADLMSRDIIAIPKHLSVRGAAHRLAQSQVGGAPVIDETGRCVGVLSMTDLVRWMDRGEAPCRRPLAREEFHTPWQMYDLDRMPEEEVGRVMTTDLVSVTPQTRIGELARQMLDAHIHRLFVLDDMGRPAGVVATTDVLAAVVDYDRRDRASSAPPPGTACALDRDWEGSPGPASRTGAP